MKYLLIILLFTQLNSMSQNTGISNGTCVIFYLSSDSIVIAADSKETITTKNGSYSNPPVCKIKYAKNIYFATSGFYNIIDLDNFNKQLINIDDTMLSVINKQKNIDSIIPVFVRKMNAGIRTLLANNAIPIEYFSTYISQFAEYCICTFYNKNPKFIYGYLKILDNTKQSFQLGNVNINLYKELPNVFIIGRKDHLEALYKIKDIFPTNPVEDKMKKLIEIEIENHKATIGLPIDILKVKKTSIMWVERNKECQ